MKAEIERRLSLTDRLEQFLRAHPGEWLTMDALAEVAGVGGWRSRLSDCRRKRRMFIEHNGQNGAASRHRFLPYAPLARDASEYTVTLPLFDQGHPRS